MADPVIRLQPLGEPWQTLGAGRFRGVVAENLEASSDDWGPLAMNFQLKAVDGAALRPDLLPYTPIEYEQDGVVCWAGRTRARPSSENEHAVQCEGWQFNLDDDVFDRAYVHTRLSDYRDQRQFLGAALANFHVAGVVTQDAGAVVVGWPNGAVIPAGGSVGVTLDLGPDSIAKRVVMSWESTNNAAGVTAFARATDVENALAATFDNAFSFAMNTGAAGTNAGTFTTARRYIHIFLNSAAGATLAADVHLRITSVKVFRDTAYESGNASILKADTIVKDALTFATQLNQAVSLIVAGTFSIPEYLTAGYTTPREVIAAINAFENYRIKIGGSDLRTLIYDVKPSAPLFEVGNWAGAAFADGSVFGDDIYSRVVVQATGPDGAPLISKRTQTGTLPDRRGYNRSKVLPIRSALTPAVADRFGDLWLVEHKTSPFAGKLTATGLAVRRVQSGPRVPPHELLLYGGEKIRLAHRVDPDTGAWARDGRIKAVTYRHNDRTAEIDIDDQRDRFEKVLARYGVVTDQLN